MREQASSLRQWAQRLHRAELSGDWSDVARVRAELAETALGYHGQAEALFPAARR